MPRRTPCLTLILLDPFRNEFQLPSIREVLIATHREPRLDLHRRDEGRWNSLTAGKGETLDLLSVAARVGLDEVYRDGLEDLA